MNDSRVNFCATLYVSILLTLGATQVIAAEGQEGQIVIEDLSMSQLRAEIKKIETEFYRVYNANIEDKNLAIVCYEFVPTGSNIKEEACEPQFAYDKRAENANDSRFGVDILYSQQSLNSELAKEYAALTDAMTKLIKDNQYFRELNAILAALRQELANR